MQQLLTYQWEVFIAIEVSSLFCLLLFFSMRYLFANTQSSYFFLVLFFIMIVLEAVLAFVVYQQTGEFTTFHIVIVIFILYAATFGINDFKKLDRYMKSKIGKWRGIELLTEKDREIMVRLKDPKVIARNARYWFYAHTVVFLAAIGFFWTYAGNHDYSMIYFITNLEWFQDELSVPRPFSDELLTNIVQIWLIVYVVDSIVNWSYTLFPSDNQ